MVSHPTVSCRTSTMNPTARASRAAALAAFTSSNCASNRPRTRRTASPTARSPCDFNEPPRSHQRCESRRRTLIGPSSEGTASYSRPSGEHDDPAHAVVSGDIAGGSAPRSPGSFSRASRSSVSAPRALVSPWARGRFHASWSRSQSLASTAARAASVSVSGRDRATKALLPIRLRPGATRGECSSGGASCGHEPGYHRCV